MSTNERDTHFQEFAKLLWQELDEKGEFNVDMESDRSHDIVTEIIARRAFDLAEHVIKHQHGSDLDEMQNEGLTHFLEVSYPEYSRLPDMMSFPKD